MNSYARMIDTNRLAEEFVDNILKIKSERERDRAVYDIVAAERNIFNYESYNDLLPENCTIPNVSYLMI